MPNNNSPRTPVHPPRGLALPQGVPRRRVVRTPSPVNNLENNNAFIRRNVARAINFNNIPMTPPTQAPMNNNRLPSPSPRTKKKRLEQVKATNYLSKYKNMLNNKKNYNTINKNTKNFNIENPVFLLSDVYESKDGKVKVIYHDHFLFRAWKNRTIFKSPATGVRSKEGLAIYFNPEWYHNKVIATPTQLKKYKDNKKILINTIGEEMFIEHFLVPVIKDKLPYVMKFIKIIHANHGNFDNFFVDVLGFTRNDLPWLQLEELHKLTKEEVDKCINVYNKLQKLSINMKRHTRTEHHIYKNLYVTYLTIKIIWGHTQPSLKTVYKSYKRTKQYREILSKLNLSIFKNELNLSTLNK